MGYSVNKQEMSYTGRSIKSNTYYIKDSTGVLIGILCINFDITAAQNAVKSLEEFMGTTKSSGFENDKNTSGSIKDFTIKIIEDIIRNSKIPTNRMTTKEKIEILKLLKQRSFQD
ncbi:MAG: PAS domain-containing protein [Lutisporaceae bacterium]